MEFPRFNSRTPSDTENRRRAGRPVRPLVGGVLASALTAALVLSALVGSAAARPRPRLRVPGHIPTWAMDDGCSAGVGASAALVRRWVTFAESDCGVGAAKALRDCHAGPRVYCRVMQYLDADWQFADTSMRLATIATSSWWLHQPAPHQGLSIYSSANGGGYLIDQAQPATRAFFRSYVRSHFNSDDGLFMDDQAPGLVEELFYASCGCSTTSEIRSNQQLQAAHSLMSAALTHRNGAPFLQVDNSLAPNPFLPEGFGMLNPATGVDGIAGDGIPENNGTLDPYYSTLLDQISYTATRTHAFLLLESHGPAGAPYELQSRRVQEATMLLGFSPGHLVDRANLEVGSSSLPVWPEQGIYPTHPLQSMRAPRGRGCLAGTGMMCALGGHHDLQVAPGVYRRVFARCYQAGASFGPCAAVVNTTPRPVLVSPRWLDRAFHHEITLVGGDVQSHGTIDVTGAPFSAGDSAVPADDALLLAR